MKTIENKCTGATLIKWRELRDLQPHNLKMPFHNEKTKKSIIELGFANPFDVWIDPQTNEAKICDGHNRKDILLELIADGFQVPDELPCTFLDNTKIKTEQEAIKYLLRVFNVKRNPIDTETLENWLEDCDLSVDDVAFDDLDLKFDINEEIEVEKLEPSEKDDEVREPAEKYTFVNKGDVWLLGKHRLVCGDSTVITDVEKLMEGKKADMIFTDPPYGISHSGKGISGATKQNDFGEILNDNDVSVAIDFFHLCQSTFAEATLIFWGANYYCSCIPNGFGWLIWNKEREGNTFSGAEIAFVNKGVKVDLFTHQWHGMIKASERNNKRIHPTQKPIALVEWCFDNYNAGTVILDGFAGSGSTLIACEKTKRICYTMELDEHYCGVVINRYKDFTRSDKDIFLLQDGKKIPLKEVMLSIFLRN
jgi:DNA modification methylase